MVSEHYASEGSASRVTRDHGQMRNGCHHFLQRKLGRRLDYTSAGQRVPPCVSCHRVVGIRSLTRAANKTLAAHVARGCAVRASFVLFTVFAYSKSFAAGPSRASS